MRRAIPVLLALALAAPWEASARPRFTPRGWSRHKHAHHRHGCVPPPADTTTRETLSNIGRYNPAFGDRAEWACRDDAEMGVGDDYERYARTCAEGGGVPAATAITTTYDPATGVCTAVIQASCTRPETP